MDLPLDECMALNGLPFGASRIEVRAFVGGEAQRFRRSVVGPEGDHWPEFGIFAYYNDAEQLEALEMSKPAKVYFFGTDLISLSLCKAKQVLSSVDETMEDEGNAGISKKWGVGVWTGSGEHGQVQAVIRFANGYYD